LIVLDVLDNENGEDLPAHFLTAVEWMIKRRSIRRAKQVTDGSSPWFSAGRVFWIPALESKRLWWELFRGAASGCTFNVIAASVQAKTPSSFQQSCSNRLV
jgi:hypothetical protein